jgi:hypothetical protein
MIMGSDSGPFAGFAALIALIGSSSAALALTTGNAMPTTNLGKVTLLLMATR